MTDRGYSAGDSVLVVGTSVPMGFFGQIGKVALVRPNWIFVKFEDDDYIRGFRPYDLDWVGI